MWQAKTQIDEETLINGAVSASRLAQVLRAGRCPSDCVFDSLLPPILRLVSRQYWTPLAVAQRVAEWLDEADVESVLDVGSGAGKFCVAAALVSRARFIGLEHRADLVNAARSLASTLEVTDRTWFVCGSLGRCYLPSVDAFYLYNPFEENLLPVDERLDDRVELSRARHSEDIAATEQLLLRARLGTHLITYNGFGGRVPPSYREVRVDRTLGNPLRMWTKVETRAIRGPAWREQESALPHSMSESARPR